MKGWKAPYRMDCGDVVKHFQVCTPLFSAAETEALSSRANEKVLARRDHTLFGKTRADAKQR